MRRLLFFISIILVYFLANYYVFSHIGILIRDSSLWIKLVYFFITGLLSTSFFFFFLFSRKMPIYLATFFYRIGAGWMMILLYSFLIFLGYDFFKIINNHLNLIAQNQINGWYGIGIIILFLILIFTYGFINYLHKRRIFLQLSTQKDLKSKVKILAISDLHLGYAIRQKELKQWINKINKEEPDIVLIAGDIVDNSVKPLEYYNLYKHFHSIKAPLGIYSCLGNHEYISGLKDSIRFLQKSAIRLLKDEAVLIDDNFYLVGRDDRTNLGRKPVSKLLEGLDKNKPVILLDHQPYHLEEAEDNNIDIQISGHTHSGQVWPLSLITEAIYENAHGYLKKGDTHIYVSSGIGIWGGRFRIGTQSEYVVIEFKKNREE